ncbi:MAG TPA: molybdopterin cofactor-binding domain-containing protein [Devosiaceae bacterium]|jgi:CO/xanthine dehydrogenase Mo-binding subunit
MNEILTPKGMTRRSLLAGAGALVVSFSLFSQSLGQEAGAAKPPPLPGDLPGSPMLDSWLRIDADGKVTVFTGKAELGQGMKTALRQVAAEELEVDAAAIDLITADTQLTPDEGFTAGSMTMSNSGTAIRNVAAQVREILIGQAAIKLNVPAEQLHAENGAVIGPDGKPIPYGQLVADQLLHVNAQPTSKLKDPGSFRVMGKSMQRVDIPGKVTGGQSYVQDMRMPNMAHARVIRQPSYNAVLTDVDTSAVEKAPGVIKVVRDGSFLAVIAEQEFQAIKAMRMLASAAKWSEKPSLYDENNISAGLKAMPLQDGVVADSKTAPVGVVKTFEGTFSRGYMAHGSIGPSCALGLMEDGNLTVWTHTQGVAPDRKAIAQMLGVADTTVRCIHVEGSGCYGHNGADDAAGDAALLARALPGRPVRVQWTREQEHSWEPFGPAMVTHMKAGLDANNKIASWDYELWSNNHGSRPGSAGALIAARALSTPFPPDEQKLSISPNGNGDRNADPLYSVPSKKVIWHFIKDDVVRGSALRALGAYANVFSIESTMDELAIMAGADPVAFRLDHMQDKRARDVITKAAEQFNWTNDPLPKGKGRGFSFARYKNHAAYLAMAMDIDVDLDTGKVKIGRVVAAIDSGEIVNPDGIRNQTEGGIIQSASWTLYERVRFNDTRITSVDWSTYPIMRFGAIPASIDISIMDRPGEAFLGTGEAAQGPTPACVANAIRSAIGVRLYEIPLTAEKIKAAMAASAAAA